MWYLTLYLSLLKPLESFPNGSVDIEIVPVHNSNKWTKYESLPAFFFTGKFQSSISWLILSGPSSWHPWQRLWLKCLESQIKTTHLFTPLRRPEDHGKGRRINMYIFNCTKVACSAGTKQQWFLPRHPLECGVNMPPLTGGTRACHCWTECATSDKLLSWDVWTYFLLKPSGK